TCLVSLTQVRLTDLSSADRVPPRAGQLTPESTKREARKRRASERHAVGCCEELAGQQGPCLLFVATNPKPNDDAHYNGQQWRGEERRTAKEAYRNARLTDDLVNQQAEETVCDGRSSATECKDEENPKEQVTPR